MKKHISKINGVSFIIPTWNKKDLVINCLRLLDKQLSVECPEIEKEIIVVDNGSTDNTLQEIEKLKNSLKTCLANRRVENCKLKIIANTTNLGFAKAINLASKEAKYNYLYLLNNDMEVQPGFFQNIIETANKLIKNDIIFFGISSQIFFFDPSVKKVESGKTWTKFKNGKLLVGHELDPQKLEKTSLTAYCGGGSSLINKDLFNLFGGFDNQVYTPMYGEDLDLGFIAWKKGYPSFFCPDSHVIHHHRSSSKLLSVSPDYYIHKNYLAFCLKNFDSFKLRLPLFFMYPLYLIFKKNYGKYLVDNLKNISNIIKSRQKISQIPNIYQDIELINFADFEKQNASKYQI